MGAFKTCWLCLQQACNLMKLLLKLKQIKSKKKKKKA